MSDWAVGLSTGSFYQKRIFEGLPALRDNGFDMVEVSSFPAHLDYHDLDAVRRAAGRIQELGLEPYSFHAPFSAEIDITSMDRERREMALREILAAAQGAAALGAANFIIHPGPEIEDKPPQEQIIQGLENAAGVLSQVARFCQKRGMNLVLENLLPHLLFGRTSDLLWLMGALNQPNVGVCLDTGHAHLAGDLYTAAQKLSGHLRMVHISDNRGKADDHLPPGRGKIDWRRFLTGLEEVGYRGALIMELSGDNAVDLSAVMEEAVEGRQYLRSIAREIPRRARTA
jgi:sugar phosphate isomerase/epimerase